MPNEWFLSCTFVFKYGIAKKTLAVVNRVQVWFTMGKNGFCVFTFYILLTPKCISLM